MPITNNNKPIIDLPMWEVMQPLPLASSVGVCSTTDRDGSARFFYQLFSATNFWRYDVWANSWQQLANPPAGTVGAGTDLCFDPSQGVSGSVWALISNGTAAPTFQYYDTATNVWTARSVVGLPATFGTDSALYHPDPEYNGAVGGLADNILLAGNNATAFYKYTISTNTWAAATAAPATLGAGCCVKWLPGWDDSKLVVFRGGATSTIYLYDMAGNSWTTQTAAVPATETFTTGTCYVSRGQPASKLLIQKDNTQRIYEYNPAANTITPQATQFLIAASTAVVGARMNYIKTVDGIEFLYINPHTTTGWLRTPLFF